MKPHTRHAAATLLLAAALNPAWMPQAAAATTPPASALVNVQTDPAPNVIQALIGPLDSEMAGLSTPAKYGLLLMGLTLIEKLSRQRRGR